MDYKEKYEKALESIKGFYGVLNNPILEEEMRAWFPEELAESEDEKTRKKLTKIMRDKELATCHEAFDTYGMEKNCGFLMEECGELLSAVNKLRRGRVSKDAVFEELADVQLVITAFATHLGYRRFLEVKDAKLQKLARTIGELKELEDAKTKNLKL